jgi:hypothetical protein
MCMSPKNTTITSLNKDDISITSSEPSKECRPSELQKGIKHGSYFPECTPSRPVYLAARSVSATLGIVLIILAVLANNVVNRPKWMGPILSPAINAWSASTIELVFIKWKDRRYPRLQRLFHDGAIGVGCAVAGGFLVAFTLDDIRGTRGGAGAGTMGVAWLILFCMFAEM